jgi:hypothetical protein
LLPAIGNPQGEEALLERLEETYGVGFPEGASASYDEASKRLTMVNTRKNHDLLLFGLAVPPPRPLIDSRIVVKIQLLAVDFDAADRLQRKYPAGIPVPEITGLWRQGHGKALFSETVSSSNGVNVNQTFDVPSVPPAGITGAAARSARMTLNITPILGLGGYVNLMLLPEIEEDKPDGLYRLTLSSSLVLTPGKIHLLGSLPSADGREMYYWLGHVDLFTASGERIPVPEWMNAARTPSPEPLSAASEPQFRKTYNITIPLQIPPVKESPSLPPGWSTREGGLSTLVYDSDANPAAQQNEKPDPLKVFLADRFGITFEEGASVTYRQQQGLIDMTNTQKNHDRLMLGLTQRTLPTRQVIHLHVISLTGQKTAQTLNPNPSDITGEQLLDLWTRGAGQTMTTMGTVTLNGVVPLTDLAVWEPNGDEKPRILRRLECVSVGSPGGGTELNVTSATDLSPEQADSLFPELQQGLAANLEPGKPRILAQKPSADGTSTLYLVATIQSVTAAGETVPVPDLQQHSP